MVLCAECGKSFDKIVDGGWLLDSTDGDVYMFFCSLRCLKKWSKGIKTKGE